MFLFSFISLLNWELCIQFLFLLWFYPYIFTMHSWFNNIKKQSISLSSYWITSFLDYFNSNQLLTYFVIAVQYFTFTLFIRSLTYLVIIMNDIVEYWNNFFFCRLTYIFMIPLYTIFLVYHAFQVCFLTEMHSIAFFDLCLVMDTHKC